MRRGVRGSPAVPTARRPTGTHKVPTACAPANGMRVRGEEVGWAAALALRRWQTEHDVVIASEGGVPVRARTRGALRSQ
eukprot:6279038-Prymnesium_polylepis.1